MIDLWHLSNIEWLHNLPESVGNELLQAAEIRHYSRNAKIFEPAIAPQQVFILEAGLIRIYRESPEAEEFTFGFISPGEIFGECAVFPPARRESFAVAAEPSDVLILDGPLFAATIREQPAVFYTVAKQIEGRFKNIESRVENLAFRNARSRLAHIIRQLGEDFGKHLNGHTVLKIHLTHAELASLIGTSRPTVSIFLRAFEDQGIVSRTDGQLTILDAAALQDAIRVYR